MVFEVHFRVVHGANIFACGQTHIMPSTESRAFSR